MREHATRLIVMECHRETRTHTFSTYLLRSPDCASSTSLRHVTQFEGAGTGHAAFQKADGVRAWRRTCRAGASVRTNRTHVSREHRRMSDIAMRTSPPCRVGFGRVASPSSSRSSFFNGGKLMSLLKSLRRLNTNGRFPISVPPPPTCVAFNQNSKLNC